MSINAHVATRSPGRVAQYWRVIAGARRRLLHYAGGRYKGVYQKRHASSTASCHRNVRRGIEPSLPAGSGWRVFGPIHRFDSPARGCARPVPLVNRRGDIAWRYDDDLLTMDPDGEIWSSGTSKSLSGGRWRYFPPDHRFLLGAWRAFSARKPRRQLFYGSRFDRAPTIVATSLF